MIDNSWSLSEIQKFILFNEQSLHREGLPASLFLKKHFNGNDWTTNLYGQIFIRNEVIQKHLWGQLGISIQDTIGKLSKYSIEIVDQLRKEG